MHYCCYVITKDFPSDDVIAKIIAPFNEENEESSKLAFTWDWWQVGGRYNGKLKLKVDLENDDVYRWQFLEKEPRAGRLFRSYVLEKIKNEILTARPRYFFDEEMYYWSMGVRDSFIYCDGGLITDIVNADEQITECYCIVDKDGNGFARSTWNGNDFVKNDEFDDQCKKILSESGGCYIVTVDLHD